MSKRPPGERQTVILDPSDQVKVTLLIEPISRQQSESQHPVSRSKHQDHHYNSEQSKDRSAKYQHHSYDKHSGHRNESIAHERTRNDRHLEQQLDSIQAKCKTIIDQNRTFCDEKRRIIEKVRELKSRNRDKSETIQELEERLKETRDGNMRLQGRNASLGQNYCVLEHKLDQSVKGIKCLQQELVAKDKVIVRLQCELNEQKQMNTSLNKQVSKMKRLEAMNMELRERVEQLTNQLSDTRGIHQSQTRTHQGFQRYSTPKEPLDSHPAQSNNARHLDSGFNERETINPHGRNHRNSQDQFHRNSQEIRNEVKERSTESNQRYGHERSRLPDEDYRFASRSGDLMFRQATSTPQKRPALNPQFDDIVEDLFFQ
ncbi:hypothetical protein WDU94_013488 [Cyamophila willieti]